MNRKQVAAKMKRLVGPKAMWSVNERALVGDERAAVAATLSATHAAKKLALEQMAARKKALLDADPEYCRLVAEMNAADKANNEASAAVYCRRISLGKTDQLGLGFHVLAHGDTWSEAFAELERKRAGGGL